MSDQNQVISAITAEIVASDLTGKKWYESKTVWTNVLVGIALLIQTRYGFIITPDVQALALVAINLGLRKVTHQPVVW